MRCLWLSRSLPFPQDSGDRIYSGQLARALAQAGAEVDFVGHRSAESEPPPDWPLRWHAIDGGCRPTWRALASQQPMNGAIHDTAAYRARLAEMLTWRWDAVVIDTYGMGWTLGQVKRVTQQRARPPALVHISHNHEAALWRGMVREFHGSPLRKFALWQNMLKVERIERRLASEVDLMSCITAEDARAFAAQAAHAAVPTLVLTPGYSGAEALPHPITDATPRRVVLMGSFRWVAKQENLKALVQCADAAFRANGIELDVIGDVPAELREQLARFSSVVVHGFVDDAEPYFRNARMALVPEVIGGGFKLKFLDYVFGRMPVVTLNDAAAGVPAAVRNAMLGCADLDALVQTVVDRIDDLPTLARLQRDALAAARTAFDWSDRGRALFRAVRELGHSAAGNRSSFSEPAPRASA
jgi:glycosyltransferase involved in cell wall biosynthesis